MAKFSFQKCVLGTPVVIESVLGKSFARSVCLSGSCLSHDVTRTLCYWQQHMPLCEEYILTNNLTARRHCDLSLHLWLRLSLLQLFLFCISFHFKLI